MLKLLIPLATLILTGGQACASDFDATLRQLGLQVKRMPFGSGTPTTGKPEGSEHAEHVADGLFHVPNYLPGHPTAATIWPREVMIECDDAASELQPSCSGYAVHPAVGRGEYLFVRPMLKAVAPPPATPAPTPETPLPVTRKKTLG